MLDLSTKSWELQDEIRSLIEQLGFFRWLGGVKEEFLRRGMFGKSGGVAWSAFGGPNAI
jgi:hypothetical protein